MELIITTLFVSFFIHLMPESYKLPFTKHIFTVTEFPIKHLSFTLRVILLHQFSINTALKQSF